MEASKQIPLDEKDVKKLKRKRLMILIFYIYMWLTFLGVTVGAVFFYFTEVERWPAYLMGSIALGLTIVVFILRRSWKNIKTDLILGNKEVVQGEVTDKYWHKNRYELTIDEKVYLVNSEQYEAVKEGQVVLIGFAPMSKITLDIRPIEY